MDGRAECSHLLHARGGGASVQGRSRQTLYHRNKLVARIHRNGKRVDGRHAQVCSLLSHPSLVESFSRLQCCERGHLNICHASSSRNSKNENIVVEEVDGEVPEERPAQHKKRGRPKKSAEDLESRDVDGTSSSDDAVDLVSLTDFVEAEMNNGAEENDGPTELIFKLSRRGYGWGEEIIPHLTVEKRPLKSAPSSRRKKTVDMTVGTDDVRDSPETVLNAYLVDIGVPEDEVERLVNAAVAWRMTPGGRPLIDRRRQSRLTRNVKIVAKYLVEKCDVPLGKDGVAAVFMRTPELMLCKPSNNDRWDRRAVELAAFLLKNGHCNVPEVYPENQELGMWVKRQRVTRAAGQLSAERLTILERMGFEFGDLAQVTEEWETRFDMLVDWVLWHGESGETFSWDLIHWGKKGGITARELALWISLQREFYKRQLLPAEAVHRFEAVYSGWRDSGDSAEEDDWMSWLGRLVYVIERRRLAMRRPPTGRGNPFSSQRNGKLNATPRSEKYEVEPRESSRANIARRQVVNTVSSRREAAAASPFSEDPGLRYWLSRQRWLWRKSKLDPERVRMLQLTGIDMDIYTADVWREMAHATAECLQGTRIRIKLDSETINVTSFSKLRITRWVETQRALFLDGRLSPGQLRYMTFLGLTWVLSDKVVDASNSVWTAKLNALKVHMSSSTEVEMPFDLADWVSQQRALHYLNWLDEKRQAKLQSLGFSLQVQEPTEEEEIWNERLGQILIHNQDVGHTDITPENETYQGLHHWTEDCKERIETGSLSPGKVAQLKAVGIIATS